MNFSQEPSKESLGESYKRNLAQVAVTGHPPEAIVYGVFTEFVMSHKIPLSRFVLSPQLSLKWKPEGDEDLEVLHTDQRAEIPDFGIGHYTLPGSNPPLKLRCGVEIKRAVVEMDTLPMPPPYSLINNWNVMSAFHGLYFQALDQAKAAYKNDYPLCEDGVYWILLVGPYWTVERLGPFTEAQMTVRSKKTSDSGDYGETVRLIKEMERIRKLRELYILSSDESFHRLKEILGSTDQVAQPYIDAMVNN